MIMGKDFKIWGFSYGLIGDLIMALPQLTYMEKLYPGSYKYWVIEKKVSQCAQLFLNHPLIDRIYIEQEWSSSGPKDHILRDKCSIILPKNGNHRPQDWFNYTECIRETANLAGLKDLDQVLTPEEMYPKLYKWFPYESNMPENNGYTRAYTSPSEEMVVAIWPFANYTMVPQRSPSPTWWKKMIELLIQHDFRVHHFGFSAEPDLSTHKAYQKCTHTSFFDQVQKSLQSKLAVGTDSGSMWVLGAYQHPAIHLTTNWVSGHKKNFEAFVPANKKGTSFFAKNDINKIAQDDVLKTVIERI